MKRNHVWNVHLKLFSIYKRRAEPVMVFHTNSVWFHLCTTYSCFGCSYTTLCTAESKSSDEEGEDTEKSEEEDAEDKPKTKKVKETTYEWELLNDVKAIWLRNPKEVTDEEYTKFYHSLAKVLCIFIF